ncbi:MAG: DUF120 domain-containing protein [Cenarchaeum sp. SB0678_bin_8]|nr:DUF120 domain-containing protein [Cenarchaeum sp. SB0667_bin_13]MXZ92929.1 DUF120 domain-containing protein [Cenarchaeum sp. SB0666_bin_15]MYB46949.1 DUF120 domain-containing protein [Cenarchaeum sp. SB0662_bin_33]MYD59322.1 DUF120 domain-containing protein [Cenarchaeum sp. SB0678_bin_8]MYG33433.1 DUF120 domain-containing protein [Cenarchaeum sp. SB0677_bin_16]MYI51358.1 DUF120 domain-containing protein [Cenarchaeum sp. SB0673_bin_9]MYJ27559.1 DUF120 domain-containing protein [Cenarchaeum 
MTLAHLMTLGCQDRFVPVTTLTLGQAVGVSQQAASIHLAELESNGLIQREAEGRGRHIRVTKKGYAEVMRISSILNTAMQYRPPCVTLQGEVVSGVGEGAYYMSLPGYITQFCSKIELTPYPGTLNVRLDAESARTILGIGEFSNVLIDGFSDGQRTYGWVRCYPILILPDINCYMIRLERTHHDPCIMEIISDVHLRSKADITDGSRITVSILPGD